MTKSGILSIDFDGVLHSYTSGWCEVDFIPDPPVPGAFEFLVKALDVFDVQIFSSRSRTPEGRRAMKLWMQYWARKELTNADPDYLANKVINQIVLNEAAWPSDKPNARISLDDRGWQFTGTWPDLEQMKEFQPWNKK